MAGGAEARGPAATVATVAVAGHSNGHVTCVCRFLGAGGYGEVYLCKWASVDVAVKCLNPGLIMGAGAAMTVGDEGFNSSSSDAMWQASTCVLVLCMNYCENQSWRAPCRVASTTGSMGVGSVALHTNGKALFGMCSCNQILVCHKSGLQKGQFCAISTLTSACTGNFLHLLVAELFREAVMLGSLRHPSIYVCHMHVLVAELIREAMMLGSLRHPNVVWVYGIVLPPQLEHLKAHVTKCVNNLCMEKLEAWILSSS
eukprot:1162046-Pelagomonas_calceolata.AAC.12